MEYRNAVQLGNGNIDCEIKHPSLGWIPFTVCQKEINPFFDVASLYNKIIDDKKFKPFTPPTEDEIFHLTALNLAKEAEYLLIKSDIVILRCYEADKVVPESWVAYRNKLRRLLSKNVEEVKQGIPVQPPFPD